MEGGDDPLAHVVRAKCAAVPEVVIIMILLLIIIITIISIVIYIYMCIYIYIYTHTHTRHACVPEVALQSDFALLHWAPRVHVSYQLR